MDAVTTAANTTIIAVFEGHRKVLKQTNVAGWDNFRHNISPANKLTGIKEFWFASSDVTKSSPLYLYDGASAIVQIKIDASKFQYVTAGAWNDCGLAAVNNTWYHVKIQWYDAATDTFDIWINGTLYQNGVNCVNNMVMGIDYVYVYSYDHDTYIDAIGYSWDANYNVGDNLRVDWHDQYNKEEITAISQYPMISPRLDAYYTGSIEIRDFEGVLFVDWYDRDFNKILIEDDSSNVLFRGYLTKKKFKKDSLTLFIAGIGIMLDWMPFGSEGYVNYILAEGLVKAPISANSIIQLKDSEGADFIWTPDWWIEGEKDLGLLIVDKTDVNTRTWDSSAISQVGGTVIAGNNASATTFNDSDYYNVRDTTISPNNLDLIVTPIIDGAAVDDTDYLKSIQIEYNFRARISNGGYGRNYATFYFQIFNGTEWITIKSIFIDNYLGTYTSGWKTGVPIDVDGGNGNQFVIEDTDAELQKYFNKTGATYTSLKGMRFKVVGKLEAGGYVEVHVDFINVLVGYMSDDTSPVMETITDSTATSITCEDVSKWDEMGVVENDGFKIGQNTRVIVQDISGELGLGIYCSPKSLEFTLRPTGNGTIDWQNDNYTNVDEETPDASVARAEQAENGTYTGWTFADTVELAEHEYISKITVYTYGKMVGTDPGCSVNCYYNGAWLGSVGAGFTNAYGWHEQEFTSLGGGTVDPDDLAIRYSAMTVNADDKIYIDTAYVIVTTKFTNAFDKYMARKFKGKYCMELLKAICELEGAHWYEDYINDRIVTVRAEDFSDSTVDLTEANYGQDWEYEDDCNQIKSFYVFGKSEDEIFAKAVDESVSGFVSKQLIDETITTVGAAQEIADAQLALLKTKRPSIKITLTGVNALLQLGTTVGLTMVRPTVAAADYPIRMIERSKFGAGIKTVIYCGLGESSIGEEIAKIIRDNAFRSHKSLTDRLVSP